MRRREETLCKHPSYEKIWQGSDGFWRTYVPDPKKPGKRKLVKRKKREDIEELLIKEVKRTEK